MKLFDVNTDLVELFDQTIQWNKLANHGQFDFSQSRRDLQLDCLSEEILELISAKHEKDDVEILDALCDILFVSVYALFMKIATSEPIEESLSPNFYPDLTLDGLVSELTSAFRDEDYFYICELILSYSLEYDFDFKDAYQEVVESNYSKFPTVFSFNPERELDWFENGSKYQNVVCTTVKVMQPCQEIEGAQFNADRFVFRSNYGDGKVVKPRCFREPNLSQFILYAGCKL